jgi:hypothetical protein
VALSSWLASYYGSILHCEIGDHDVIDAMVPEVLPNMSVQVPSKFPWNTISRSLPIVVESFGIGHYFYRQILSAPFSAADDVTTSVAMLATWAAYILYLLSTVGRKFGLPRSSHTQLAVTRAMNQLRPRITGT